MRNIFCKIGIFFVLALVFSCSQDPIFFTISTEPIPVKPRIQGGPTNMAVFNSRMYVASGKLFSYNGASGWDDSMQPGGKVIGLAATDDHLYALCIIGSGVTTVLRRWEPNEGWTDIGNAEGRYTLIQSIYATTGTPNRLFAGAMNNSGSDYGILYLDNTTLKLLEIKDNEGKTVNTEMLSGAARLGAFHYLSTRGRGVFQVAADNSVKQLGEAENPDIKDRLFMGMIQLNTDGPIIVIERNEGTFFEVQADGFRRLTYSSGAAVTSGKFATGALAVWQQVTANDDGTLNYIDGKKMLVAGIQGGLFSSTTTTSSYSHGYVEIELDSPFNYDADNKWLVLNTTRSSISPDITVDGHTDRYTATIGKHPINHFFQAPYTIDARMTFFASTQTAGLWSYREREGGLQWNAEGENEP
jgi:hypothetical protein